MVHLAFFVWVDAESARARTVGDQIQRCWMRTSEKAIHLGRTCRYRWNSSPELEKEDFFLFEKKVLLSFHYPFGLRVQSVSL